MFRSQMRLLPHDPSWRAWFEREARRITSALGALALRVEHVGSTAVPDLIAKPIVDIAVIVARAEDFEACIEPLVGLGYEYQGQNGDDPLRRYFVLEQKGRRMAQVHVCARESRTWREALAFRDLLRSRADVRAAYAREKTRVAEAVGWDKSEYSIQKGPFIRAVIAAEGLGGREASE
jgi:GrpB-like predicted nucleotidyltransferase (UPF0157 family)